MKPNETKTESELSPLDKLGRVAILMGLADNLGLETIKKFASYPREIRKAMFAPIFMLIDDELKGEDGFLSGVDRDELSEAVADFLCDENRSKVLNA